MRLTLIGQFRERRRGVYRVGICIGGNQLEPTDVKKRPTLPPGVGFVYVDHNVLAVEIFGGVHISQC